MFPEKVNSLSLQTRDITVLRGLFESRVMTTAHVAALHFTGKAEYTKTRLRQLKNAGLVAEQFPQGFREPGCEVKVLSAEAPFGKRPPSCTRSFIVRRTSQCRIGSHVITATFMN
jgi:hypothetical protein